MRDADKIVNYNELIVLSFLFFSLLYFLFPTKEQLEKLVLHENRNIDLAQKYLETILRIDPSNVSLMISLAQRYIKSGELEKAASTLRKLIPYKQKRVEIYTILYDLYTSQKDNQKIRSVIKEVATLSQYLSLPHLKKWYVRAIAFGDKESAFVFVRQIIEKEPSMKWAKEYYALASELKRNRDRKKAFEELMKSGEIRWLQEGFYFYSQNKNFEKALDLAQKLYERTGSKKWLANSAYLLEQMKRWQQAEAMWRKLLSTKKYQKEAFTHILNILLNQNRNVLSFMYEHKAIWVNDRVLVKRIIRSLLGNGRLKEAESLSDILMKEEL